MIQRMLFVLFGALVLSCATVVSCKNPDLKSWCMKHCDGKPTSGAIIKSEEQTAYICVCHEQFVEKKLDVVFNPAESLGGK